MSDEKVVNYDKLKVDLLASLSGTVPKKVKAIESVSEDFSSGTVSKLKDKEVLDEISESDTYMTNHLKDVRSIVTNLEKSKAQISKQISELRKSGKLNKAQNLKHAYKSLKYAIEDLEDAIELIEYLIS